MHEPSASVLDALRNVDCEYRFYYFLLNSKLDRNEQEQF